MTPGNIESQAGLAQGNLMWLKMPLLTAGGWIRWDLNVLSNPNQPMPNPQHTGGTHQWLTSHIPVPEGTKPAPHEPGFP